MYATYRTYRGPLLIALALISTVCAIAAMIAGDSALNRFDHAIAANLQPLLTAPMLSTLVAITYLGDRITLTILTIVVAGLLLWRGNRTLAIIWVLALAGNGLFNRIMKALFQRERPSHLHGLIVETDWSFPSGHSSGAMIGYGLLTFILLRLFPVARRNALIAGAALLIGAIGFSRIALQVHYVSDVIAGFATGAVWLVAAIAASDHFAAGPQR